MQIDVFSLLTDARQRLAAHAAAVEALRDFWLASVSLSAAVAGGGSVNNETTMAGLKSAPAASADH
jgi:outer membrane protein TolC